MYITCNFMVRRWFKTKINSHDSHCGATQKWCRWYWEEILCIVLIERRTGDMKVMRKVLLLNTFNNDVYSFKCELVDKFIATIE